MDIRLGLVCINTILRNKSPPIFNSRTCIRSTYTVEKAKGLAMRNIIDLYKMIDWNVENKIKCFRLTSCLFPHIHDPEVENYTIDFAKDELKKVGDYIKERGIRIVMHPGQYNQLGSPTENVVRATFNDLTHHCDVLDAMGMPDDSVAIVHIGGTYGNKGECIKRWIMNFGRLPENVKRRLVIENCERGWSVIECLKMSKLCFEQTGIRIPVVFDFHHNDCWNIIYPNDQTPEFIDFIDELVETWNGRRILMHISDQDLSKKIGAHADYIEKLPDQLFDSRIIEKGIKMDIEVEAKMKEQAILRLYDKYEWLLENPACPPPPRQLIKLRYKLKIRRDDK